METIRTTYTGELSTKAIHIQSAQIIITDAPVDNQGRGEAFSPTDLLAAALGSCMLTTMAIEGRQHGFSIEGTEVKITKIMASNPRRVKEIVLELFFPPNNYPDKHKMVIRNVAETCPVALSLHRDLEQTLIFHFD